MKCKVCDYRLWNLTSRICPECGTPFRPSEYEFPPNTVQFRCPHCSQSYFGTGPKGHLIPTEFDCVTCGRHIHMDEMVLLPREDLKESDTEVRRMPWLERERRGFFKAWLQTCGMALASPTDLMRRTPINSDSGIAFGFAMISQLLFMGAAMSPLILFVIVAMAVAGGPPPFGLWEIMGIGLSFLIGLVIVGVLILVWCVISHGLLKLTGATAGGFGRTLQAISYGSGANAAFVVPCLGWYFSWVWWLVSAVLMVKEGQRTGGLRATVAVACPPIVLMVGAGIGYGMWINFVFNNMGAGGAFVGGNAVQVHELSTAQEALVNYASENEGQGPPHAGYLATDAGYDANDFVAMNTETFLDEVPIGNTDLAEFVMMGPEDQREQVRIAAEALPADVGAHRVGDLVFTYHGIDFDEGDGRLWVIIGSPNSDSMATPMPPTDVSVARLDGSVELINIIALSAKLAEQNELREQADLPLLLNPRGVTHDVPLPIIQTQPAPLPAQPAMPVPVESLESGT